MSLKHNQGFFGLQNFPSTKDTKFHEKLTKKTRTYELLELWKILHLSAKYVTYNKSIELFERFTFNNIVLLLTSRRRFDQLLELFWSGQLKIKIVDLNTLEVAHIYSSVANK